MSDYPGSKVEGSYVADQAVNEPKIASELKKGEKPDENKCDRCEIQHYPQAQKCVLQNIKISNVCSLSKVSFHHNSSVASRFKESYLDPAGSNDLKLLSESDVKHIPLDSHSASESSNKSDCNVREVEAWLSENVSTTLDNHKGKNLNKFIFNDVTEEGGLSNEPKLSVTPTVSSPVSKFSRIQTRSIAKSTRIETHTRNYDAQRRSNSSVGQSIVPSDNTSKPDTEENLENKSSDKKFCCVLSWTASIYGQQRQCSCALAKSTTTPSGGYIPQSSASVKQLALHIESYRDYVLIKDLDSSKSTVQKETTFPPQLNPQGQHKLPLLIRKKSNGKSEEHNQSEVKTKDSFLRKKSGEGRRKSQALELSEGENSNLQGKWETMLNPVSALETCAESRVNLLDRQEKAVLSHSTRNVLDLTLGRKKLSNLKNDESEQIMSARNEGGSSYVQSKQMDFRETSVHEKCSSSIHYQDKGPEANTEPHGQSLPFDREYSSNCADQESENVINLALDKHDINPDSSGDNAVINESDCSNEGIDRSLGSTEDPMKQFKYNSLLCNDGSGYVPHSAMVSENTTSDKTTEKIQNNKHGNEFCCMLGWSAQVCGEQSKCSCKFVSPTTNFEMNELISHISLQSCKDKFPLIKDTKTWGTRSADKSSSAQNSSEFSVLPPIQTLMGEMSPEIDSEDKHDFPDMLKKQPRSKTLFTPGETTKTPSASREKSRSLGLDKQNISFVETSRLSPPRRYKPKSCLVCDNCKPESDQKTLNKHNLKTCKENKDQVVKSSQKILLHKGKTCSKRCNPDLQTESYSQLEVSKHYDCVVKYSNDEITPAVKEPKCNDEYEQCGQKLGIKGKLGHDGERHRRQKKRKSNFLGSERRSAKMRKFVRSNICGKEPIAGLPTCDAAAKTPDASTRPKSQPSLQGKIHIKQCFVKLCMLPLPLDGKFPLDNPRETSKTAESKVKLTLS
ncbi:uncharacterized protein [Phyllobates terribilis]|uniref:uncharacterized protein n=1 Tax=Phyllobates terribilis TaxID=111132 RepID=UPI003CCAADCC